MSAEYFNSACSCSQNGNGFSASSNQNSSNTHSSSNSSTPSDQSDNTQISDNPPNATDPTDQNFDDASIPNQDGLVEFIRGEFRQAISHPSRSVDTVSQRIATEVERICRKSDRIQNSGEIRSWQITLAQHRLQKCLSYHTLGSRRGRVELHSTLSAMVYRHIAARQAHLGFQGRYSLIEDFLQGFYIEVLNAFRRENKLVPDYSPRTRLELAEYMAFAEHYAKRRISLPGRRNQQLIVLRAQGFAQRQPIETSLDIETAIESAKSEDAEIQHRSPLAQQVREQMVADVIDPSDSVLRDRVVAELIAYLESQSQSDCIDYLTLKLQDLSAPEIDEILGLTPRQRDYLQQRFKYHVEKFARQHNWQLVHQWLGADLDQNLGMPQQQWEEFLDQLSPQQRHLLELKQAQARNKHAAHLSDREISKTLKWTQKQMQKNWVRILDLAWQMRNSSNR
ncbi:MAG: HetZ-related protein [Elainellaceae cyanobacterium]